MVRVTLFVLSVTALCAGQLHAQNPPPPPPPPAPVPVIQPGATTPAIPPGATTPAIPVPPPPPPPAVPFAVQPMDPIPVPVVPVQPLPAQPRTLDTPGFIAGLELDVLLPTIHSQQSSTVFVNGFADTVSLPNAGLTWTGSPRIELGYRLPENAGAVSASYRSIVSNGSENVPFFNFFGGANLTSRLNANIIDLDYLGPHVALAPCWDLNSRAGLRIAAIYYDSRLQGMLIYERTNNNFVGAGPHVGAEVARSLQLPGVAVFGGLDLATVIGGSDQNYEEVITFPDGTAFGGANRTTSTAVSPALTFRLGVSYTPPVDALRWSRFSLGYQFEQWWNVGHTQSDLNIQGFFFRGEFRF